MKFTDEVLKKITAALVERLPGKRLGNCSVCGVAKWRIADVFVALEATKRLTLQEEEKEKSLLHADEHVFPSAVLLCTNCGNTHLMNLFILGLQELFAPEPEPQEKKLVAGSSADSPPLHPPDTRQQNEPKA